ncbi:MAG TPA: hypothetical protein VIU11_11030 [Nakamurella sp.]
MTHALILARLQGRELLRRRLALALLVGMPVAFYLTSVGAGTADAGADLWAAVSGAIGMGFAVCGAAFFSMLAGRGVDPRLVLFGWRPAELIAGRLLLLGAVAAVIGVGFFALMELTWWPAYPGALAAAIATAALVSVSAGLAIAALLPNEMEGILVVILFVGIQMSVPPSTAAGPFMPYYGAQELLVRATTGGPLLAPTLHACGWAAALLVLAVLMWRRRLRLTVTRPAAEVLA